VLSRSQKELSHTFFLFSALIPGIKAEKVDFSFFLRRLNSGIKVKVLEAEHPES